jgi:hypothetical protein
MHLHFFKTDHRPMPCLPDRPGASTGLTCDEHAIGLALPLIGFVFPFLGGLRSPSRHMFVDFGFNEIDDGSGQGSPHGGHHLVG